MTKKNPRETPDSIGFVMNVSTRIRSGSGDTLRHLRDGDVASHELSIANGSKRAGLNYTVWSNVEGPGLEYPDEPRHDKWYVSGGFDEDALDPVDVVVTQIRHTGGAHSSPHRIRVVPTAGYTEYEDAIDCDEKHQKVVCS